MIQSSADVRQRQNLLFQRALNPGLQLLSLIPDSSELTSRLPRVQPGYPVVGLSYLYGGHLSVADPEKSPGGPYPPYF